MATIINLTPHTINVLGADGARIADLPSAGVARVKANTDDAGMVAGIPVVRTNYGEIEGLPEPEAGTHYVVSSLLAAAAKVAGRDTSDLLVPGPLVRNDAGQPVGCQGLSLV